VKRRVAAALGALGCLLLHGAFVSSTATAHPLGNFTINELAQVRISEDKAEIHYVLDEAEIPTFQQVQQFDSDHSGSIEGAERGLLLRSNLEEISSGLRLSADGRPARLGSPEDAALSFPAGQGGLALTRIEVRFEAPLPEGAREVELVNDAYSGRIGWHALQILRGEGTDVTSSVPATDPTDGLRAYPQDLLSSPPDQRRASFSVAPGTGSVSAPPGLSGGPATHDRALDGFANALAGRDAHGLLILFLLLAAFGWGAFHALSPGHGKAMVAGYLVGSQGTAREAVILGLTVTAVHTAAVFALGLVTLAASQYVLPDQLYPWLGVASGLMVVTIGFGVMRSRWRRWRSLRSADATHAQPHRGGDHQYRPHNHPPGHSHHRSGGPITKRGLIALGVSGGIVPCPSALVVLIGAISQHRVGLGMVLILAFSFGLAATLTAIGLAVIWGGRLLQRLGVERRVLGGRVAGALPAISASLIVLAGTLITLRALPQLGS